MPVALACFAPEDFMLDEWRVLVEVFIMPPVCVALPECSAALGFIATVACILADAPDFALILLESVLVLEADFEAAGLAEAAALAEAAGGAAWAAVKPNAPASPKPARTLSLQVAVRRVALRCGVLFVFIECLQWLAALEKRLRPSTGQRLNLQP
jgi:hypothetical protein